MTINQIRKKIQSVDMAIIKLLAERKRYVCEIGQLKSKTAQVIVDPRRERQLMSQYALLAKRYQLPIRLVKQLFKLIILYSRGVQQPK